MIPEMFFFQKKKIDPPREADGCLGFLNVLWAFWNCYFDPVKKKQLRIPTQKYIVHLKT